MKKDRDYFLAEAQKLIKGPRAKDYGPVKKNHQRIADIWTILLGGFGLHQTFSYIKYKVNIKIYL